ncbi:MAG TPA: hypothetical protein VMV94_21080 [Phycisphaerae bacterium]|nr:hypothetical protein [Phycisphaerae bacterium]
MSDATNPKTNAKPDLPPTEPRRSVLFSDLPPALRQSLDRAIAEHDPPTYREIHEKFRLAERGVNFYAFYRYARRVRHIAEMMHLAELTAPNEADLLPTLPKLIAQRLFETLLCEDAPASLIQQLTNAYRQASAILLAREKLTAALATAGNYVKEKQNDDFLKMVNQFIAVAGEHTKAHEAHIKKLNEKGGEPS